MKISHEVPLTLLKESRVFNDYDYALVHLFAKYPEYYRFFEESLKMGRTVYLDNSLYELGKSFDPGEFLKWINKLKPTYYIIPDTFWDAKGTMYQAMDWFLNWAPKLECNTKSIGVAQGDTYEAIAKSYRFMCSMADMVAFTFKFAPDFVSNSGDVFQSMFYSTYNMTEINGLINEENSSTVRDAIIRYAVLRQLRKDGIIDTSKPHHLLGMQNTLFLDNIAKNYPWVTSIDTSNPIICGMIEKPYAYKGMVGNPEAPKPKEVLADFFEVEPTGRQFQIIRDNVQVFNRLAKPLTSDI